MKNKILYGVMVILFTCSTSVNAQLKIAENGCVGIGCSAPLSKLSIGGNGMSNAKLSLLGNSGTGIQYGIYSCLTYGTNNTWRTAVYGLSQALGGHVAGVKGEALSPSNATGNFYMYGVYGLAGCGSNGRNYGVFGRLRDGETAGAGVYGTNSADLPTTIPEKFAGYFWGNTKVNGDIYANNISNTSDARLKTNITDIKLEHYGLLAQEVQKLFPELVHEDGAGYLSVNYMELIPLLIQAVQELSAEVDELKAKQ